MTGIGRGRATAVVLALALLGAGLAVVLPTQRTGAATAAGASAAAATALPAVAVSELRALAPAGTRPQDSRRAVSSGGESVFVTPAPGGACLTLVGDDGATVSCRPRAAADRPAGAAPPATKLTGCAFADPASAAADAGTPGPGRIRCDAVTVYGLAPAGTTDVALEVRSGDAPAVAFANGAYLVRAPLAQRPAAVRFASAGTAAAVPVDVAAFGG